MVAGGRDHVSPHLSGSRGAGPCQLSPKWQQGGKQLETCRGKAAWKGMTGGDLVLPRSEDLVLIRISYC